MGLTIKPWMFQCQAKENELMSKPIDCTTPRENPDVNYGPWVTMTCQRSFIDYINVVGSVDSGGVCLCDCVEGGQGVSGKSLCLAVNFAVNLKLLLKSKVY